jgi:hypothetical protein
MNKYLTYALVLAIASPYIIAFVPNPADSSATTVELGAGFGSYTDVSRDCEGDVVSVRKVPFSDVGASVTHQISSVRFGIAGGSVSGDRHSFGYSSTSGERSRDWFVNPKLGIQYRDFGMDIGYIIPLNDQPSPFYDFSAAGSWYPSLAFRFAPLSGIHWTVSFANNLPLLTGGGLGEMGLVFPLNNSLESRLGIGLGVYPWDRLSLSAKTDFPLTDRFGIGVRSQIGLGREALEYGLALVGRAKF